MTVNIGNMRPDSRSGQQVITGYVDNANGASTPKVIINANDFSYNIDVPMTPVEAFGANLDFDEGEPRLYFTVIGNFQSGVLVGAKYYGAGGGSVTILVNNNHTFSGWAHLKRDHGHFARWAIIGRVKRFIVPSYGARVISGYLTNWTETCNGNT
jgi:hypothetical protein